MFSTVGAERARSDELIQQLHLLGEVFANALSRKQGELEAQRLRQDLTHIGRVSALGELTASLAHELNQPLTAILSNAQAAQRLLAGRRRESREGARDPERHRGGRQAGRRRDPAGCAACSRRATPSSCLSTSTRSSVKWRGS